MKKNLLFCCEKWCAGDPKIGLTISFHILFDTIDQAQNEYVINTLHIDESALIYNKHIDDVLINYCLNFKPAIVIFCLLEGYPHNPTINCFNKLKSMGIKLCFMWPDTSLRVLGNIAEVSDIADLSVSLDNPTSNTHDNIKFENNHIFLWTPKNKNMFYDDEKCIDVSFVGSSSYPDRREILTQLKSYYSIVIDGDQRVNQLSPDKYAEIIRTSKICLNFPFSPCQQYYQTKGKTFEVLASNSLLMEALNPATRKLLKPDKEYVEFNNIHDLVDKIGYYLNNSNERIQISKSGHETYKRKYTSQIFWDIVLDRLK